MTEKQIIGPAQKRALEASERRILDARRDVVTGLAAVGIELKVIRDQELYLASHIGWEEYLQDRWNENAKRASDLIRLGERFPSILSKAKELNLPVPDNEWQMRPLLKLDPDQAVSVYVKAAKHANAKKQPLSQEIIRPFAEEVGKEPPPRSKVLPIPDEFGDADDRFEAFSEGAQKTIHRIGDLINDAAMQAVLDRVISLTDRELEEWGTHEDDNFLLIGKHVIEQQWPYRKTVRFLFEPISLATKAETLINLAIEKGGRAQVKLNGFTIDIYKDK
jgi:hypothetical protein